MIKVSEELEKSGTGQTKKYVAEVVGKIDKEQK